MGFFEVFLSVFIGAMAASYSVVWILNRLAEKRVTDATIRFIDGDHDLPDNAMIICFPDCWQRQEMDAFTKKLYRAIKKQPFKVLN